MRLRIRYMLISSVIVLLQVQYTSQGVVGSRIKSTLSNLVFSRSLESRSTDLQQNAIQSSLIFSFFLVLGVIFTSLLNFKPPSHRFQHKLNPEHFSELAEKLLEEDEEEEKEIGIAAKKLGIAREVIIIITESFNKAAHDLHVVNSLLEVQRETRQEEGIHAGKLANSQTRSKNKTKT